MDPKAKSRSEKTVGEAGLINLYFKISQGFRKLGLSFN
jgi:hypothetical protein